METQLPEQDLEARSELEEEPRGSELDDFTFLTSDIVGSSEMFHRHPQAMSSTLERHDRILHDTIRSYGGNPFKHTGDGVFAVFVNALAAVQAAIEAQDKMRAADWGATGRPRIRWGLHTGQARARGGDYFGPALAGASRLEEAANPDQILISETVRAHMGDRAQGAGIKLADLGSFHFKGTAPTIVYQVCTEQTPDPLPDLGGKRETADGNLPAEVSSFVGRSEELETLSEMLGRTRLITLTGAGGLGKSRLALQTARRHLGNVPDGAWFLSLSALDAGTDLWPVLASSLGLDAAPANDKRGAVLARMADARALILIDGCEHMLDEVDALVSDLMAHCPHVALLCTSQRALLLPGEAQFEVPPLGQGDPEVPVQLFVERARLVKTEFDPGQEDRAVISSICERLDFIPLAIEIAASQVRRYPLDHIARDAVQPEKMRAGGGGGRRRQRAEAGRTTLRRTFDWSYGLLDDTSQKVLKRLSVFAGAFHEDQALAVCSLDIGDEVEILDSIDELIDASLLSNPFAGERRFRLLRTMRGFARGKLEKLDLLPAFERRHGEVYAELVATLAKRFVTGEELSAAQAIQAEVDNLRTAFERALENDLGLAARLVAPLKLHNYYHRGSETAAWPARVMARPGADQLPEAPILLANAASYALHELGDSDAARAYLKRGHAAEVAGVGQSGGWLSHVEGHVEIWSGRVAEFMPHHRAVIDAIHASEEPDVALEIIDASTAAYLAGTRKDVDTARASVERLNALESQVTQPSLVGYIFFGRAGLSIATGADDVVAHLKSAIQWADIGGNVLGARRIMSALSDRLSRGAPPERQVQIQTEMLNDLPDQGAAIYIWLSINRMLAPLARLERFEDLSVLAGALSVSPISHSASAKAYLDVAREGLGGDQFDTAFARGKQFDAKDARAFAKAL